MAQPPPPDLHAPVSSWSETALISLIRSTLPAAPPWVIVGIGDDAAVVEPDRNRLQVLTVDAVVDGVHVDRRFTPPHAIGHRALACNLSDLAAMGAAPRVALLSLSLPPSMRAHELQELARGLADLARRHRVQVVGGNLTRTTGPLVVDVTAIGSVKRRDVLTRSRARPGDELYVSGSLGAAAAGLERLRKGLVEPDDATPPFEVDANGGPASTNGCVVRYLYPEPRIRLGTLLARNRAVTACIDLSDGLADGVHRLAEASGIGIAVDASLLPVDADARGWFEGRGADAAAAAIAGSDDYELLFTIRPRLRGRLRHVERHAGIALTRIGTCTDDGRVVLRRAGSDESGEAPMPRGYTHFA